MVMKMGLGLGLAPRKIRRLFRIVHYMQSVCKADAWDIVHQAYRFTTFQVGLLAGFANITLVSRILGRVRT